MALLFLCIKRKCWNVEKYSSITLLGVVGKLFTSILNTPLSEWAEEYQVYVEAQSEFRKRLNTVDNIYVMHSLITRCIIDKNYMLLLLTF